MQERKVNRMMEEVGGRKGEKKGGDGFVKFPFCLRTYQISVIPLVVQ